MPDAPQSAELRLPQRSNALSATIGYSLVLILTFVATFNLVFAEDVAIATAIASILYLFLVMWIVFDDMREEGGLRKYIVKRLGACSGQHFVKAIPQHDTETILFGYVIFGRFLSYLAIDVKAISSINWSSGQATALAGRDMRDWHLALWYHDPERTGRKLSPSVCEEEIFIIGDSGPREALEAFGREFVRFLVGVGVDLSPGRDNREFIVGSSSSINGEKR